MKTKVKRNRSKRRHIPIGAEINADGSWFYKFENPTVVKRPDGTIIGSTYGFGELICNAE